MYAVTGLYILYIPKPQNHPSVESKGLILNKWLDDYKLLSLCKFFGILVSHLFLMLV